jgi:hypothetical protein
MKHAYYIKCTVSGRLAGFEIIKKINLRQLLHFSNFRLNTQQFPLNALENYLTINKGFPNTCKDNNVTYSDNN